MSASRFGMMLRQLRKDRGVTLHEVAEATGISVPMLSRMERGERLPSSETLKLLSGYYGTSARLLAEAAGHEHSLNRYRDSLGDGSPDATTPALSQVAFGNGAVLSLSDTSLPELDVAQTFASRPARAAFRAQPISALFEPGAEAPADAVDDATVAAEAAIRQLGRELQRSAQSMSPADRRRVREEVQRLGEALKAIDAAPWWQGS